MAETGQFMPAISMREQASVLGMLPTILGVGILLYGAVASWNPWGDHPYGSFLESSWKLLSLGITLTAIGICFDILEIRRNQRSAWTQRGSLAKIVCVVLISAVIIGANLVGAEKRHINSLQKVEDGIEWDIHGLTRGFYGPWSYTWVWIHTGRAVPQEDPRLLVYEADASWGLNSSSLTGASPAARDFGARDFGGAWFNLTITDFEGDGIVTDGDLLRIYSHNATFANDVRHFFQFGISYYGGVAPFYLILGFELSDGKLRSWVEGQPNLLAL